MARQFAVAALIIKSRPSIPLRHPCDLEYRDPVSCHLPKSVVCHTAVDLTFSSTLFRLPPFLAVDCPA
jgi:hypothetical protein